LIVHTKGLEVVDIAGGLDFFALEILKGVKPHSAGRRARRESSLKLKRSEVWKLWKETLYILHKGRGCLVIEISTKGGSGTRHYASFTTANDQKSF
jgi:hypothetical protein